MQKPLKQKSQGFGMADETHPNEKTPLLDTPILNRIFKSKSPPRATEGVLALENRLRLFVDYVVENIMIPTFNAWVVAERQRRPYPPFERRVSEWGVFHPDYLLSFDRFPSFMPSDEVTVAR